MKYINLFDTQADYDATKKYYPNVSYIEATDEVVYQYEPDYSKEYLTFEALESGTFTLTVPATVDSTKMTSISYSVDNGTTWTDTTIDSTAQTITTPSVAQGDKVIWKGLGNAFASDSTIIKSSTFSSTGNFNVSGNIMSLLYWDNFASQTSFPNVNGSRYAFNCLLCNNSKLLSAENLILPATTLVGSAYHLLFMGCTALTTVPGLPATRLASQCYECMFDGCTSLTTVPSNMLPATTLDGCSRCYYGMFQNCTALTAAPALPATRLASQCYESMFKDCTSLTTAPALPATTLVSQCYSFMFNGTNVLPDTSNIDFTSSTVVASGGLQGLFGGTKVTYNDLLTILPLDANNKPCLPCTTLAKNCYDVMFFNCTSLTTAPVLPATTLAKNCYEYMFKKCSNLNNITMLATDISARGCLTDWVNGVAATGTFTKAASMTTLPTGLNGIPSGWTVVDA